MKTQLYRFFAEDGQVLELIGPEDIVFPSYKLEYYETITSCGAGEGFGDRLVPDCIIAVRITLACYIHDIMWAMAEPSWEEFHMSNSVFLSNTITLITAASADHKINILKNFRMYRAVSYFNAVDTIGARVFWCMKEVAA